MVANIQKPHFENIVTMKKDGTFELNLDYFNFLGG